MSNRSASRSTILPLPSSPHWAPMTAITISQRSEVRHEKNEIPDFKFEIQIRDRRSKAGHKTGAARSRNKHSRARISGDLGSGGRADVLVQHARDRAFGS